MNGEPQQRMKRHTILGWIQWVGSHELKLLMGLVGVTASIVVFVRIAALAIGETTIGFDTRIILALRSAGDANDPLGPLWLEEAMRDLTALGSVTFLSLVVLAATGYLLLVRELRTALFLVASVSGGVAISFFLKAGFDRPRPALVAPEAEVFTSSFPSSHAMAAAVTYLTLGAMLAQSQESRGVKGYLLLVSMLMTFAVGLSRVYLGVHWPTDIVAGWAAGAGWALTAWVLARVLGSRRSIEPAMHGSARNSTIPRVDAAVEPVTEKSKSDRGEPDGP